MDFREGINSCKCFAEGRCPNQRLMERAYLIPRLMDPVDLQACEEFCMYLCVSQSRVDSVISPSPLHHPTPSKQGVGS